MTTQKNIDISAQVTPNPNTLKFMVNVQLIESGSVDFISADQADISPLVQSLFKLTGVKGVMLGTHFVSVSKDPDAEWTELAGPITDTIRQSLESDTAPADAAGVKKRQEEQATSAGHTDDEAIADQIKHILDEEIRPAVAMDGGDIQFHSFKDGVLTLYLQGACASCPSATLTLKMGIENRLKEEFPEIKEVVQVA